jgi:hypothetical protein
MVEMSAGISDMLIKYDAGYTVATDNAGHTALVTAGNVPGDLLTVVCYVANDLQTLASGSESSTTGGIPSNLLKSETIGDFSYTRFDAGSTSSFKSTSVVNAVVNKYADLLDRYTKKNFIG